jgi:predicted AlkP superfamily phosphohydrolase/phosphomutase
MNLNPSATEPSTSAPARKVLVIGLDGASWALLDPLIASGRLPQLEGLIKKGAKGVLESTIPPVTASAWSSLYTGRAPGSHGVFDFRRRMSPDSTHRDWVNHCSIRGPKLWEIAAIQGKTAGLINLPLTFPPAEINGYVVAGMPVPPARDDIGLPPGLVDEIIRETGGYVSDIDLLRGESPDVTDPEVCRRFVSEVDRALEARIRAIEYLMESHPTDLTACVLIAPDRLSHLFWKILVPAEGGQPSLEKWEEDLRERMVAVLSKMDEGIGKVTARAGREDLVVILSDHGFGPLDEILKLNRLLCEIGYLKFRPEVDGGFRKKIAKFLPEAVKRPLRSIVGLGPGMKKDSEGRKEFDPYSLINWEATRAYSGGSVEQGVFINVAGREPHGTVLPGGEYHKTRDELISALRKVKHPSTGQPLFDWVEPRENIYSGECVELAPDVIYSLGNYRAVVGEDAQPPLISQWSQPRAGYHRRDGIIIATGPMIREGIVATGARIEDIAPTVLACWGLKAETGMDGKVLADIIKPDFLEAHPPVRESYFSAVCEAAGVGAEDSAEMEDLLKGLGYLS